MTYSDFFRCATTYEPFGFQQRFRQAMESSLVLQAPTGLGKTETALVAWLHWRATDPRRAPRRLIWCLPGRALTEQVAKKAEECIGRLAGAGALPGIPVFRLLGGSADNDARLAPNEPAVLVGTQDLLLSRALNRGYARHPFRWPIDFGLLNNDCYWVFDEVQLLGDGLATSLQLAAFREKFGVFGTAPSCWMSATIAPGWLETADLAGGKLPRVEPDDADFANPTVAARLKAAKGLDEAPASCSLPQGAAEFVASEHRAGTLTLVIANTVRRAVEIRAALAKRTAAEVVLLHSRFRASDRQRNIRAIGESFPAAGRIIVATQVIEAGIDLDAALMVTDVAPYASMAQRFGRVNRKGEQDGRIYWVDRPLSSKQKALADAPELSEKEARNVRAPYDRIEVERCIERLRGLVSAAPADLAPIDGDRAPWEHVLRRADLVDLFDTSSDLGGNQIDISRFVRSDPERDVYVLWRDWDLKGAPPDEPEIDEGELCPAPIGEVPKTAWVWNTVRGEWERSEAIYPGMTLLLHASEGRYTSELGWSPDSRARVEPRPSAPGAIARADQDRRTYARHRQTLEAHTQAVCDAMSELLGALDCVALDGMKADLESAARFHDWGKAHPVMQKTLHGGAAGPYAELLAKSESGGKHERRFFRHELASALAMISTGESDLAAYLAAAHHGRIRVMLRSMPGERIGGAVFVRGIGEGESLPRCQLGGGVERAETRLTLQFARIGVDQAGVISWTERVLALRDELGPFRLAYLEALLRAADEAASARSAQEAAV